MTVLISEYRRPQRRELQINVAACLTFVALSALVLNTIFGPLSALLFLACGGALIASNIQHSLYTLSRWWFLLLLPAYCLLSTLWSQFPDNTLRYGTQLFLTLAIAAVIAGRVSSSTLLRSLFIVYSVGTVASLLFGYTPNGVAWTGIFASKNAFAAHVAVFALASLAVLADGGASWWVRLGALVGVAISGPLLLKAESAGAIIMVVPCVAAMMFVFASNRLSGLQKIFIVALVVLMLAVVGLYAVVNGEAILAQILDSSGKDPTLTGRTDLWSTGLSFIAERPLQGVGYRAFWVRGYAPAEQLWAMFVVPSGAGFNFHNTYISNAVEIGLVGLGLQIVIIYGGALLIGILAVVRPSPQNAFLLGMALLLILRSFIEVEVFFEFSIRSILAVCTFIYAAQGLLEWLRRSVPSDVVAPRRPAEPRDAHLGVAQ